MIVVRPDILLDAVHQGRDRRYRDIAPELIDANTDVIVTHGAAATVAVMRVIDAQKALIPIVMATCPDPVNLGVVSSLARPGGNVSGLSDAPDPVPQQVALLKAVIPKLSRLAILENPMFPGHPTIVKSVSDAAQKSGISVLPFQAVSPAEINTAFDAIVKARAQAVVIAADPAVDGAALQIAKLAIENKLATISGYREIAATGGLMSYGELLPDTYRLAAGYVAQILKGAKPSNLPVMQPTKFELIMNQKTAVILNIKIPRALLGHVIQVVD